MDQTRTSHHRMSLDEYVELEEKSPVTCSHARDMNRVWLREEVYEGDVAIPFLDARLAMDEIYEDVSLPPLSVKGEQWNPAEEEWAEEDDAD